MTSSRQPARSDQVASWSPVASDEELRLHLQQRLSFFAKLMFWIFWILVGFVFGMYERYPAIRPPRVEIALAFAVVALVIAAVLWRAVIRRPTASMRGLYAVDATYAAMVGAAHGVSIYLQAELLSAIHTAFFFQTLVVFSRAIIVPSSGRRTALVTTLSFLPILTGGIAVAIVYPEHIDLPPPAFCGGAVLFMGFAVLLAATGSWVIYGLRRQVDEARQVGQYTLDELIGAGGMGSVYRARHALLRRPTAIKLLRPGKFDAESLARFEREVQHMGRLTHPNAVAVFDYGRSLNGAFYYVMEYLDGVDLETLVKEHGAQPPSRVVHILVQICGALEEAHGMDLTHRDVKPANVILCQRGQVPDVVKVVDFGLVKDITRAADSTNAIMGTPAYISPEGVTEPALVGPPSDLYSLGAVAYYLLTGKRVFDGKTAVELCRQHVTVTPTPPSQRTTSPIPADLEALVMSCLAKDPALRPASARALRLALADLPVYREWSEASALAWWRRFVALREADRQARSMSHSGLTMSVDTSARPR